MTKPIRHYNASVPDAGPASLGELPALASSLLRGAKVRIDDDGTALLDLADRNGVLPWLAWHYQAGSLEAADAAASDRLRRALRQANAEKMLGDAELARLFGAARARGIGMLVIKGEALARGLYPDPACRPTADFDLLVAPGQLPATQELLAGLGYFTLYGFHGTHVFAEQFFRHIDADSGRVSQVDLHWDISNRRYFRDRLPLARLLAAAAEVDFPGGSCNVPSLPHSLLIACVHLAGTFAEDGLQLKWLLDIHLLLEALDEAQLDALAAEARAMKLEDVLAWQCAVTCEVLGPGRHGERFAGTASPAMTTRRRLYRWSHEHRWFDLLEYGVRLRGWGEKREFLRQVNAYRRVRKQSPRGRGD